MLIYIYLLVHQCYILNKNHKVLPINIAGELYIGGDGVSNGYLKRDDLNAEKFIKYTTLHELAHAFAYLYDKSIGHNKVWKQIAIALGDDGKRCHDYARPINASVRKPTKRTECICNKCGTKSYLTNIKIKRIKENPYSYTCCCGNYAIYNMHKIYKSL